MRRQPTKSEALLWRALRGRQVDNRKFRRQAPIGPFIADFFCPEAYLVIEVDGRVHDYTWADTDRDRWMLQEGIRILRVRHDDVMTNLEGVVESIREAARGPEPLPPAPSPKGRGDS